MSAINRGSERREADCYVTPPRLCRSIVRSLVKHHVIRSPRCGWQTTRPTMRVLEPSAGAGTFVEALIDVCPHELQVVQAVDIVVGNRLSRVCQERGVDVTAQRFQTFKEGDWDLILGNPPYSEAQEHIEHGLTLLNEWGWLFFLLRVNFLGSTDRVSFWKKYPPYWILPISPRPYYLDLDLKRLLGKHGRPGQDATEYAMFGWGAPQFKRPAQDTRIIPITWCKKDRRVLKLRKRGAISELCD